jgi:hypothetical protein
MILAPQQRRIRIQDNVSGRIADAVRRGLRGFGIARPDTETPAVAPPPLMDDPMEALLHRQGGEAAAFRCPIDRCTHFVGFGFAASGWHPFVATLLEYRAGLATDYDRSLLRDYYETWQPRSAAAAFAGFDMGESPLTGLPPYCFYVTPWTAATPDTVVDCLAYWTSLENAEHGNPDLDFREHGVGYFGPTHPVKGELEYRRLTGIHDRLLATGYDRTYGDVSVRALRRGEELRFIVDGGGYHRTAALAAAGEKEVPATFVEPFVIAEEDARYWPQVRRGVWTRDAAIRYFHHLFDFDSREWAREHGLLLEQKHPPSRPG